MTKFIEKMYKMFPWVNVNTGLLFLRIGVGLIFITTGYMKCSGMPATIAYFASLGFSAFWAYLVGFIEFVGGLTVLLGVGVYTRVSAKLLSIIMLVAMYLLRSNFEMEMTPLLMFFVTVAIMCTGPGKYAVWREKSE
jgi:putative oxidoreductase